LTSTAPTRDRPATIAPAVVSRSIESKGTDIKGAVFQGLLLLTLIMSLAILVVLVIYVAIGSWDVLSERPVDFITSPLSSGGDAATVAGVSQGIRGSIIIAVITALLAFPLGIATAVYLEEYASDGAVVRFITLNVRNLAGVPSVVFGLLGLNLFVNTLGQDLDPTSALGIVGRVLLVLLAIGCAAAAVGAVLLVVRAVRRRAKPAALVGSLIGVAVWLGIMYQSGQYIRVTWRDYDDGGLTGGRTVVSGGVTIAALVLPIVIITTIEALRAVPKAIREAGFGVGASRWEVTKSLVLPSAAPGILTGAVLSISRAIGEAAPILLIGASTSFFSSGNQSFAEQLRGGFTALPAIIFGWARNAGSEWESPTSAAIIVILLLTFVTNAIAIILRNRYERTW
jgi:phosphate transport system permease protein